MRGEGGAHLDYVRGERRGTLSTEEGKAIEGATANLEVVKGTGVVPEIDAEGQDRASELESPPPSEVENTKDRVEKYLEEIFRNFPSNVYRVKDLNEIALGHKIDFTQGPNDYIYTISPLEADKMKDLLNQTISGPDLGAGVRLSGMTGLDRDYLAEGENPIGFSRKFSVDDKEYTLRFLYLSD